MLPLRISLDALISKEETNGGVKVLVKNSLYSPLYVVRSHTFTQHTYNDLRIEGMEENGGNDRRAGLMQNHNATQQRETLKFRSREEEQR